MRTSQISLVAVVFSLFLGAAAPVGRAQMFGPNGDAGGGNIYANGTSSLTDAGVKSEASASPLT